MLYVGRRPIRGLFVIGNDPASIRGKTLAELCGAGRAAKYGGGLAASALKRRPSQEAARGQDGSRKRLRALRTVVINTADSAIITMTTIKAVRPPLTDDDWAADASAVRCCCNS